MKRHRYALSASLLVLLHLSACSLQSFPEARFDEVGDDITSDTDLHDATLPDGQACIEGCECVITDPNDVPSYEVLESHCGGDNANTIFVDPTGGDDLNDGTTPSSAVKSLAAALQNTTDKRVYILAAKGVFKERVTLEDGVGIFGGYDAADGWKRKTDEVVTEIDPSRDTVAFDGLTADYITVLAQDLEHPTLLDHLTIHGADAQNAGASSYVVWAHNADGLSIQNSKIIAGNGNAGDDGIAGQEGDERTCDAQGGSGGRNDAPAAKAECDAPTGVIGAADPGLDGAAGTFDSGDESPSHAGDGGSGGAHDCPKYLVSCGPGNGLEGTPGDAGEAGGPGSAGAPLGRVTGDGLWQSDGGESATDGGNGTGGGGGGAGGNCVANPGTRKGDNGGYGGEGGCGGTHGENGQPGGASFGIFASHSNLALGGLVITQGEAGNGGDGAKGGVGQPSANIERTWASGRDNRGGYGGDGGLGGDGAAGGDGAGGCGGPSIGIAKFASAFEIPEDVEFMAPVDPSTAGADAFDLADESGPERCDGLIENDYDFGG